MLLFLCIVEEKPNVLTRDDFVCTKEHPATQETSSEVVEKKNITFYVIYIIFVILLNVIYPNNMRGAGQRIRSITSWHNNYMYVI